MLRIRLAYVERSQAFRFEWMHPADHFTNEGKGEDDGVKSFVEKLTDTSSPLVENLLSLEPESRVSLCPPNAISSFSISHQEEGV
jgi:hypothetical protein